MSLVKISVSDIAEYRKIACERQSQHVSKNLNENNFIKLLLRNIFSLICSLSFQLTIVVSSCIYKLT